MTPLIQNLVRPQRWKAAAPSAPAGTSTYGQQDQLPRLPVPELLETATRLKESLRPLARSSAELAAVEAKIGSLTSAGGLGPVLQKRLEERQRDTPHWLEEWWDDGKHMYPYVWFCSSS
jgi:carnitine O-acetyltransferase